MKPLTLCCLGLLTLPLAAHAIDPGPSSPQQQETEVWLQLQSHNVVASEKPQTATATERELSMQRWLKSYQQEIPQFFDQYEGGKVQSGSGQ